MRALEALTTSGHQATADVFRWPNVKKRFTSPGRDEPHAIEPSFAYALRLLQYVRDESHRFAQHYHHLLRRKKTLGDA